MCAIIDNVKQLGLLTCRRIRRCRSTASMHNYAYFLLMGHMNVTNVILGGFIIIESSLESSFELLEFLLDEIFVTKFTDWSAYN